MLADAAAAPAHLRDEQQQHLAPPAAKRARTGGGAAATSGSTLTLASLPALLSGRLGVTVKQTCVKWAQLVGAADDAGDAGLVPLAQLLPHTGVLLQHFEARVAAEAPLQQLQPTTAALRLGELSRLLRLPVVQSQLGIARVQPAAEALEAARRHYVTAAAAVQAASTMAELPQLLEEAGLSPAHAGRVTTTVSTWALAVHGFADDADEVQLAALLLQPVPLLRMLQRLVSGAAASSTAAAASAAAGLSTLQPAAAAAILGDAARVLQLPPIQQELGAAAAAAVAGVLTAAQQALRGPRGGISSALAALIAAGSAAGDAAVVPPVARPHRAAAAGDGGGVSAPRKQQTGKQQRGAREPEQQHAGAGSGPAPDAAAGTRMTAPVPAASTTPLVTAAASAPATTTNTAAAAAAAAAATPAAAVPAQPAPSLHQHGCAVSAAEARVLQLIRQHQLAFGLHDVLLPFRAGMRSLRGLPPGHSRLERFWHDVQAVATAATQPQQQQGGSGQVNLQAAVAELMTNVGKQAASSR